MKSRLIVLCAVVVLILMAYASITPKSDGEKGGKMFYRPGLEEALNASQGR